MDADSWTTLPTWDLLRTRLAQAPAVLVRVVAVQGSAPREVGAWMAVWADTLLGSVGGGHLEQEATALAQQALAQPMPLAQALPQGPRRFALGPSLGQCCGGVVHLSFEPVAPAQADEVCRHLQGDEWARRMPVALFGGGHVGRALVRALEPLPVALHWIDSRDEVFPSSLPPHVRTEHSAPVQAAVPTLAPGTHVLVMSFSHAEDLEIVAACLARLRMSNDLPFVGLIGSQSKWAAFGHRLAARGYSDAEMARITCPIGLPGVHGKEPAVIAAAVAAQLMTWRHQGLYTPRG